MECADVGVLFPTDLSQQSGRAQPRKIDSVEANVSIESQYEAKFKAIEEQIRMENERDELDKAWGREIVRNMINRFLNFQSKRAENSREMYEHWEVMRQVMGKGKTMEQLDEVDKLKAKKQAQKLFETLRLQDITDDKLYTLDAKDEDELNDEANDDETKENEDWAGFLQQFTPLYGIDLKKLFKKNNKLSLVLYEDGLNRGVDPTKAYTELMAMNDAPFLVVKTLNSVKINVDPDNVKDQLRESLPVIVALNLLRVHADTLKQRSAKLKDMRKEDKSKNDIEFAEREIQFIQARFKAHRYDIVDLLMLHAEQGYTGNFTGSPPRRKPVSEGSHVTTWMESPYKNMGTQTREAKRREFDSVKKDRIFGYEIPTEYTYPSRANGNTLLHRIYLFFTVFRYTEYHPWHQASWWHPSVDDLIGEHLNDEQNTYKSSGKEEKAYDYDHLLTAEGKTRYGTEVTFQTSVDICRQQSRGGALPG